MIPETAPPPIEESLRMDMRWLKGGSNTLMNWTENYEWNDNTVDGKYYGDTIHHQKAHAETHLRSDW